VWFRTWSAGKCCASWLSTSSVGDEARLVWCVSMPHRFMSTSLATTTPCTMTFLSASAHTPLAREPRANTNTRCPVWSQTKSRVSRVPVESSRASPPNRPREDGLVQLADTSRSNLASPLGLHSSWRQTLQRVWFFSPAGRPVRRAAPPAAGTSSSRGQRTCPARGAPFERLGTAAGPWTPPPAG
jgi:hypothetical protein